LESRVIADPWSLIDPMTIGAADAL
jgi:hypothetical protein